MSFETGKAVARRLHDVRFATRYFVGNGIDIGSGTDPLSNYGKLFPLIRSIQLWDKPQGDAQYMAGVQDKTFDFVHSSHCLEHMVDVDEAMENWIRITKPGGYLIIVVPDETLYEQHVWPSQHNPDHKHSFNIADSMSRMPRSITLLEDLYHWCGLVQVLKVELVDAGYSYGLPPMDQSALTACEPAIEVILRRRPDDAT